MQLTQSQHLPRRWDRIASLAAVLTAAAIAALSWTSAAQASYYQGIPFCPQGHDKWGNQITPTQTGEWVPIGAGERCIGNLPVRIQILGVVASPGWGDATSVGKSNYDGTGGNPYPATRSEAGGFYGPYIANGSNPAFPTIINNMPVWWAYKGGWNGWYP
jgi:hypothetical protein